MNTLEAINRLTYTVSNSNKCNDSDKEALNQIIDDYNKIASNNVKEHYLLAKLYCGFLIVNMEKSGDIIEANKDVNKILKHPLKGLLQRLLSVFKHQNLNNYFNKKAVYDPFLNKQNFEDYEHLFPELSHESVEQAWDALDIDTLTSHFEFSVNQSIINFKNHA